MISRKGIEMRIAKWLRHVFLFVVAWLKTNITSIKTPPITNMIMLSIWPRLKNGVKNRNMSDIGVWDMKLNYLIQGNGLKNWKANLLLINFRINIQNDQLSSLSVVSFKLELHIWSKAQTSQSVQGSILATYVDAAFQCSNSLPLYYFINHYGA